MKNFDKQTLDNFRIDFDSAMIDLQQNMVFVLSLVVLIIHKQISLLKLRLI